MKKLLTLILTVGLLTACSGGTEGTTITDSEETFFFTYRTAEYEIDVPDDWETITAFSSEYPDNIRIAFRDNIKDGDFTANVTVFKEDNEKQRLNADISQKYLSDHSDTLINYELVSQEEVVLDLLGAASQSILNTYEGKNDTNDPNITYMQTYLVEGDIVWVVTASYYAPTEDEFTVERLETMLKSFTAR
jgi:hypothetical protein